MSKVWRFNLFIRNYQLEGFRSIRIYWPEQFRSIRNYWLEQFRSIRNYWPEQFRSIRNYWPEGFPSITSSFNFYALARSSIWDEVWWSDVDHWPMVSWSVSKQEVKPPRINIFLLSVLSFMTGCLQFFVSLSQVPVVCFGWELWSCGGDVLWLAWNYSHVAKSQL